MKPTRSAFRAATSAAPPAAWSPFGARRRRAGRARSRLAVIARAVAVLMAITDVSPAAATGAAAGSHPEDAASAARAAPARAATPSDADGAVVVAFDLDRAQLGRQTEADLQRIVVGEESIRHGGIGTADTFVCDRADGELCPDYDGSRGRVLAFRHPARRHYAGTWNGLIRFRPLDEAWLAYRVRYSSSWDPSRDRGKLWGLGGVSATGSQLGDDRPPMHGADARAGDGWSARRTVKRGGQVVDYLYDPAKHRPPYHDNRFGDRAWWGAPGATGGSNRHVDGWWRGEQLIDNGRWYQLVQHVDVNAGLVASYLDGRLVARTTGRPLAEAGAPVNALLAHAYIGSAGNRDHTQHDEVWTYLTDVTVTTTDPRQPPVEPDPATAASPDDATADQAAAICTALADQLTAATGAPDGLLPDDHHRSLAPACAAPAAPSGPLAAALTAALEATPEGPAAPHSADLDAASAPSPSDVMRGSAAACPSPLDPDPDDVPEEQS